MISVEEALHRILSFVDVLEAETKPITECLGQVLAEDIYSEFDIPALDNAAMDGFAVQFSSITGATPHRPKVLRVISDEIAAGSITDREVAPGTAIRIMTGAPVPKGADTVVTFEDTDEKERRASASESSLREVGIRQEIPKGSNIRWAGEDIKKGRLVLNKGRVFGPAEIGVLASLGKATTSVFRRPVVAILATGNELIHIGNPLAPGKIYNSNSYGLAAQVLRYGGIPKLLGIAPDNFSFLVEAIHQGFDSDLLITSGGVSVGDYDVVKDVLAKEGEINFWSVRMKPGRPLVFGVFRDKTGRKIPHLGLPGNPVSAMVTFEVFARPVILKMMGKTNLTKPTVKAVLRSTIQNEDGRRVFARVKVVEEEGNYFATLTGSQGSNILTSMVQANGLAIVPEEMRMVQPGDVVEVMMLGWDKPQN